MSVVKSSKLLATSVQICRCGRLSVAAALTSTRPAVCITLAYTLWEYWTTSDNSGGDGNFHFGGTAVIQGIWGTKPLLAGVQGRSPGGVCEMKFPSSWSSLQTMFTDFDCRNDQNLKTSSHNYLLYSWAVCSTVDGHVTFCPMPEKPPV